MGKGCLTPVAFVLVAVLAVWFFQDYESFEQFMLSMADKIVDLALAFAQRFLDFAAALIELLGDQEGEGG